MGRASEGDGMIVLILLLFLAVSPSAPLPAYSEAPLGQLVEAASPPTGAPPSAGSAIEAGVASWYLDGSGLYAAVPSWSFGDPRYTVHVCRLDTERCVDVVVRDSCACPGARVIDLSRDAFSRLADPSVGLLVVTVEWPSIPLPATDTP